MRVLTAVAVLIGVPLTAGVLARTALARSKG
jgi:ACR3 family arsenite efflux pump ArsB